jgi:hypothetical protein
MHQLRVDHEGTRGNWRSRMRCSAVRPKRIQFLIRPLTHSSSTCVSSLMWFVRGQSEIRWNAKSRAARLRPPYLRLERAGWLSSQWESLGKRCWPASTPALSSHGPRLQQISGSVCRVGSAEREDRMELMISVVIGILIVEAYAWLPKLSEWLIDGRRKLWLRDDLDQAILPSDLRHLRDVAEDL